MGKVIMIHRLVVPSNSQCYCGERWPCGAVVAYPRLCLWKPVPCRQLGDWRTAGLCSDHYYAEIAIDKED